MVILTLDCLTAKPILSPKKKKDTAIIKLDLVYERKVEFSHICTQLPNCCFLPLSLSTPNSMCMYVFASLLLFLNCNWFVYFMENFDSILKPSSDRNFVLLSFAPTSPFGRVSLHPSRLNSAVNRSAKLIRNPFSKGRHTLLHTLTVLFPLSVEIAFIYSFILDTSHSLRHKIGTRRVFTERRKGEKCFRNSKIYGNDKSDHNTRQHYYGHTW